MRFEAKTLEEAYQKATKHYNKSVSNLNINIIQNPKKGLFGLFSKTAIIEVIDEDEKDKTQIINETKEEIKDIYSIEEVVEIAKSEIKELFEVSCFNIDKIEVKIYDDETILVEIDGEDAALLIGKEGYRYNALATLIFNWINQKYGYKTRLEIASFLENQEEMMRRFLEPVIREIEERGRAKTKPFDGILAYIAVEILRTEFPHKYVAIKKNKDGENYIIVNDFLTNG